MAIYDNNGTTNAEIGKVYDNNGTTNSQIGKVYDNNGTANSLIYNAELIVFDKDTGVGVGTWSAWNYSGHGGDSWNYGGSNTSAGVLLRSENSYTGVTEQVQRDFSQFSKVTFTITKRDKVGGNIGTTRFGISTKSLNYISGNAKKYIDITKTGTFELDLSTYNDLGYLCLIQDVSGYITMDDIILE